MVVGCAAAITWLCAGSGRFAVPGPKAAETSSVVGCVTQLPVVGQWSVEAAGVGENSGVEGDDVAVQVAVVFWNMLAMPIALALADSGRSHSWAVVALQAFARDHCRR